MSFFVDVVTEDSFYENLTLGVIKSLEATPCVKNVRIERRDGCERNSINCWEQRHCCTLSDDVKNFYSSIDGFLLEWNLEISGEEFPVGRMEINPLSLLKKYANSNKDKQIKEPEVEVIFESTGEEVVPTEGSSVPMVNSRNCKLFEIAQCFPEGSGKVYLVYQQKGGRSGAETEIWLNTEENDKWYQLADSFTKYFRMMLIHLGLPSWQLCAAEITLPTWIEQIYYLIGPHLLPSAAPPTSSISTTLWDQGPTNVLDPTIFKNKESKSKNARKK
ncbi:tubulin polyglutamylase complex subunit 2 [Prorops nasuta]|uniref:tubulin polyglutamylase complex subunit 2 n=1 Tax=Prorops nasuta TaxID=863751 RepID=UPI0034D00404